VKGKKRIFVDLFMIFFWVLWFLIFCILPELVIFFVFDYGDDFNVRLTFYIVLSIVNAGFFVLISLFFNRLCSIVTYENGLIKRRGLFGGFHCTIKPENILRIDKVFIHIDNEYYVIVDGVHGTLERPTKHASIFIPCNKKGVEFIRLFYNGYIPHFW